jgi:hypothetical protein
LVTWTYGRTSFGVLTAKEWCEKCQPYARVYGFCTAGGARFLLLHDMRNEENVKNLFYEVHELYLRVVLNPFHTPRTPIASTVFDARVRAISRKHGFAG